MKKIRKFMKPRKKRKLQLKKSLRKLLKLNLKLKTLQPKWKLLMD